MQNKTASDLTITRMFRRELGRLGIPRRRLPEFCFWNGRFRQLCTPLNYTADPVIKKAMAGCGVEHTICPVCKRADFQKAVARPRIEGNTKTNKNAARRAVSARNKWINGFDAKLAEELRADPTARQAFYHGYMIASGAFQA